MAQITGDKEFRSNNLKVEIRASGDGEAQQKKIVGYAVKWGQLSDPIWGCFQEQFRQGAFANFLNQSNADVIATWQHLVDQIIGRTTAGTLLVEEDNIGLRYEITPPSWANNYIETIDRGDVSGSSFMFRAIKTEWDDSNPDMEIRTVIEAELIEVAPVTFPAYPQSESGVRASKDIYDAHRREIEAMNAEKNAWKVSNLRKKLDILDLN